MTAPAARTVGWPGSEEELVSVQAELAAARPPAWRPPDGAYTVGACFVCFERGWAGERGTRDERGWAGEPGTHDERGWAGEPGTRDERGWAGAALTAGRLVLARAASTGRAGDAYRAGLLALREGPLLAAAVRALQRMPDVLLVNATGRDHPRRCGLALHLGAVLDVPTVGVTHRPLLAEGEWPSDTAGARRLLLIGEEPVGCWLRTRPRTRPLAVHPAWRTDAGTACAVVLAATGAVRAPEPLREARRVARLARARAGTGSE